jgi:quercetin dioxygenase-like cupin family protein
MDYRKAKWIASVAFVGLLALVTAGAQDTRPQESESGEMRVYPPGEIKWRKGPESLPPGAEIAVLEGDPSKTGPFVFRVRFPDGYTIPPHTHPRAERVTVIAGTFHIAMGEKLDRTAGQPMPAGSFGYWPAGMKHFAWVSGETIVQLHGSGPWQINYLNPADDPRNRGKP